VVRVRHATSKFRALDYGEPGGVAGDCGVEGHSTGTVLSASWRQVVFALNASVSGHVWIEIQSNGYLAVSMNAGGTATPTYSSATYPITRYVTGSVLAALSAWAAVGTHYTPHARLGNYDFTGGRPVPRTEFSRQISAGTAVSTIPVVSIRAAGQRAEYPSSAGRTRARTSYFENIITSTVPLSELCIDVTCTKGAQFERWWRYTPTSGDAGSTTFTVAVYTKSRATLLATASATLKTVALSHPASGVTRKVLMIGDSTWAGGIVAAELVNLFKWIAIRN